MSVYMLPCYLSVLIAVDIDASEYGYGRQHVAWIRLWRVN